MIKETEILTQRVILFLWKIKLCMTKIQSEIFLQSFEALKKILLLNKITRLTCRH
jgi:hypothetical protein